MVTIWTMESLSKKQKQESFIHNVTIYIYKEQGRTFWENGLLFVFPISPQTSSHKNSNQIEQKSDSCTHNDPYLWWLTSICWNWVLRRETSPWCWLRWSSARILLIWRWLCDNCGSCCRQFSVIIISVDTAVMLMIGRIALAIARRFEYAVNWSPVTCISCERYWESFFCFCRMNVSNSGWWNQRLCLLMLTWSISHISGWTETFHCRITGTLRRLNWSLYFSLHH